MNVCHGDLDCYYTTYVCLQVVATGENKYKEIAVDLGVHIREAGTRSSFGVLFLCVSMFGGIVVYFFSCISHYLP